LLGGQPDSWTTIFMRYARLFNSRLYIGYTLTFAFGTTGFFGYLAVGPGLLIEGQGLSPFKFSLSLMVIATQFVIGAYVSSHLVGKLGLDRTLWVATIGITLPALSLVIFVESPSVFTIVAPIVVFAFFNGFIFPNALAGATGVDPRIAGSASSFLGFTQLGIGSIIVFVLSNMDTSTTIPLGSCLLGLGVLTGFGMWLVRTAER